MIQFWNFCVYSLIFFTLLSCHVLSNNQYTDDDNDTLFNFQKYGRSFNQNRGTIRKLQNSDREQKFPFQKRFKKNKGNRGYDDEVKEELRLRPPSSIAANDRRLSVDPTLIHNEFDLLNATNTSTQRHLSHHNHSLQNPISIPKNLRYITAPSIEVKDFFLQIFDSQGYYQKKGQAISWRVHQYEALGASIRGVSFQSLNTSSIKSLRKALIEAQSEDMSDEGQTLVFYYLLPILSKVYTVGIIPIKNPE